MKYGLARMRLRERDTGLAYSKQRVHLVGVVTAPTVIVAIPTSFLTQSENGAWYIRPYTGFWCGTVWPVEQSIMSASRP